MNNEEEIAALEMSVIIMDTLWLSRLHRETPHEKFQYMGEMLIFMDVTEAIDAYNDPELAVYNENDTQEMKAASYTIAWFKKHLFPIAHKYSAGIMLMRNWQALMNADYSPDHAKHYTLH